MNRRPYIRNGDATNVGGQVETPMRRDMLDGKIAAYEDDPVWCPQCSTYGRISCAGERASERDPDGKRPALADDLCLCRCNPPPILIPSQTTSVSCT